ncbi:MAG: hypothetical protein ABIL12_03610 [candidate division WOR-3 bacterium]
MYWEVSTDLMDSFKFFCERFSSDSMELPNYLYRDYGNGIQIHYTDIDTLVVLECDDISARVYKGGEILKGLNFGIVSHFWNGMIIRNDTIIYQYYDVFHLAKITQLGDSLKIVSLGNAYFKKFSGMIGDIPPVGYDSVYVVKGLADTITMWFDRNGNGVFDYGTDKFGVMGFVKSDSTYNPLALFISYDPRNRKPLHPKPYPQRVEPLNNLYPVVYGMNNTQGWG